MSPSGRDYWSSKLLKQTRQAGLNGLLTMKCRITMNTAITETVERVIRVIERTLDIPDGTVTAEMFLERDLVVDEVAMQAIFTNLESEFGISIPDQVAQRLGTVQDVINFIAEQAG